MVIVPSVRSFVPLDVFENAWLPACHCHRVLPLLELSVSGADIVRVVGRKNNELQHVEQPTLWELSFLAVWHTVTGRPADRDFGV